MTMSAAAASSELPRLAARRYVTPLREGGSLPAVVEADDGHAYVMKFRGAGQGARALVAELLCGQLARAVGLPVPALALIELSDGFGRAEPDPEIQDLLRASAGLNVGLRYLPGSFGFDPVAMPDVDGWLASRIVWFDAYVTNIDRTARNPNLLWWRDQLYMIDHGAALYFHHRWSGWETRVHAPFEPIAEHVLLGRATEIDAADAMMIERLTEDAIEAAVAHVPDALLTDEGERPSAAAQREVYVRYLTARLAGRRAFVETAQAAWAEQEGAA